MPDKELAFKDKDIAPDNGRIAAVLGEQFSLYEELVSRMPQITISWNYYNDGKAWLGKLLFKKKNLGWVMIYEGFFKVTFYVTEKVVPELEKLKLPDHLISSLHEHSGKLIPLIIAPEDSQDIDTVLQLIDFKRKR